MVSANHWLRGIKTYRLSWYLTQVSAWLALTRANHASSNWAQVVFRGENAWPTALPAAFVWREVASPTAFEKKLNKTKKTAAERARQLAAGETNRLAHHQNLEVKSFYSDPAPRNVGFFLLK